MTESCKILYLDPDLVWTSPFTESAEGFADPRFQPKPSHQIFEPIFGKISNFGAQF